MSGRLLLPPIESSITGGTCLSGHQEDHRRGQRRLQRLGETHPLNVLCALTPLYQARGWYSLGHLKQGAVAFNRPLSGQAANHVDDEVTTRELSGFL